MKGNKKKMSLNEPTILRDTINEWDVNSTDHNVITNTILDFEKVFEDYPNELVGINIGRLNDFRNEMKVVSGTVDDDALNEKDRKAELTESKDDILRFMDNVIKILSNSLSE